MADGKIQLSIARIELGNFMAEQAKGLGNGSARTRNDTLALGAGSSKA